MKQVIVKAEPGSLKRPVKIAFTITPVNPSGTSHPYDPLAISPQSYNPKVEESATIMWSPQFSVGLYSAQARTCVATVPCASPHPGHAITLISPTSWSAAIPEGSLQSSLLLTNRSGARQNIVLGSQDWQIAYHSAKNSHAIIAPAAWELQAYVVDDLISYYTILKPEDLTHPIIPPILWDNLPVKSTWTLSEDHNGVLHINHPELNPVKLVEEDISKKDPLSEVLERLALMENSIQRMQDDHAATKEAVADIRNQLSNLERYGGATREQLLDSRAEFNRGIATVEAKTATLTESIDRNQGQLSLVHKAVADTQSLLGGLEQSTKNLNSRLPVLESKAEKAAASLSRLATLEDSASRTQGQVVAVEKAVHQTQDHVSLVQQMVLAKRPPGAIEVEPSSPSQNQTAGQNERPPLVEVRMEKLEKSVQEQRKAVRIIDRRLPAVEAKADKLEGELGLAQTSMAGLDRRVGVIEMKLADVGSQSSVEGSPVMFPHHLSDGPPMV